MTRLHIMEPFILAKDQHFEVVNGRGPGPHDQYPSILDQLACDGIVLLSLGVKTAQRTWSKYEQNANDIANRDRHCRRAPS